MSQAMIASRFRHFEQSVILLCVRWYLAYGLSLRDLKEMTAERGISATLFWFKQ